MNQQSSRAVIDAHAGSSSETCRLCGAGLKYTFVDLGMSPPCESFVPREQLDSMEPYYPLHVLVCDQCFLVQLKEHITPEATFQEYAYFSSYSSSWVEHARRYCHQMVERLGLDGSSLAVEIASNDGYLLQHFLPLGIPALGIEPAANVARVAIDKGVPTRIAFFGEYYARQLAADGLQADLIIGNNVLAQVPDLNDFVAGMVHILKRDGIITLEFPHLLRLIEESQFDTIYHEHFSYFSLITITHMAAQHGLKVVDVEQLPTHGGSLRVHLAHEGSRMPVADRVTRLLDTERGAGLEHIESYTSFGERARKAKRDLLAFLIAAKEDGKRICGYGAPGKGNTLLNYCGIGTDFLDFTVDRNPYKHGRFTPGMHIPIKPVEAIDLARPDYVLILPWNLKDEIIAQMRHIGDWGGKFVVPIPQTSVVDLKEIAP